MVVGLVFLTVCLGLAELVLRTGSGGPVSGVLREWLVIVGWVALWRPLDTLLYEWRPIRRRERLLRRLATAEVTLQTG